MNDLLTLNEVAAAAGITPPTVYSRVRAGRLPAPIRSGSVVRWHRDRVQEELALEQMLVSTKVAAEWLGVSRGTIRNMVADGRLPPPIRRGESDYWYRSDVMELMGLSEDSMARPDVVAVSTVRDASVNPVAELRATLSRAQELVDTLESRGAAIGAGPDAGRVDHIGRQVALASIRFDDDMELRHDEEVAGVQRRCILVEVVEGPDGATSLDFPGRRGAPSRTEGCPAQRNARRGTPVSGAGQNRRRRSDRRHCHRVGERHGRHDSDAQTGGQRGVARP